MKCEYWGKYLNMPYCLERNLECLRKRGKIETHVVTLPYKKTSIIFYCGWEKTEEIDRRGVN